MAGDFLQLADTYKPGKHKIAGFLISEKLDGTRCFWDGGISRGAKTKDVPWASVIDPKTGGPKGKVKPVATGLWSRYGNPIAAPDEFLNSLPACPLDGELWAGRNKFQLCRSICGGDEPDPRFHLIQYAVYSAPALPYVFSTRTIKNSNLHVDLKQDEIEKWVLPRLVEGFGFVTTPATFQDETMFLREFLETQNDRVFMHQQTKLPEDEDAARAAVEEYLEKVLELGGEGIILRDPKATWTPKRHKGVLKYKPYEDAEATIIGFRAGKVGKKEQVLGKIGTLIVKYGEKTFEIGSGLKMAQREWTPRGSEYARMWCEKNPGEVVPAEYTKAYHFKVGDQITFKYRELSDDGIPKEGRFWRKRDIE